MKKINKYAFGLFALQFAFQFAAPANATFISAPKTYKCPIGGEEFQYSKILSTTTWDMRLDGKPIGMISYPIKLKQCQTNGFIDFKDNYSKNELEKLKIIIESKEFIDAKNNEPQKSPQYYLLFLELDRGGYSKLDAASALHKATWELLVSTKNIDYEDLRTLNILKEFVQYIDKNSNSFDKYSRVNFKIYAANAQRELGQFEDAQKRLDEIKKSIPKANPKMNFDPESVKNHIKKIEEAIAQKSEDPNFGIDLYGTNN